MYKKKNVCSILHDTAENKIYRVTIRQILNSDLTKNCGIIILKGKKQSIRGESKRSVKRVLIFLSVQ